VLRIAGWRARLIGFAAGVAGATRALEPRRIRPVTRQDGGCVMFSHEESGAWLVAAVLAADAVILSVYFGLVAGVI
jgi:hypothetical protein